MRVPRDTPDKPDVQVYVVSPQRRELMVGLVLQDTEGPEGSLEETELEVYLVDAVLLETEVLEERRDLRV